MWSTYIGTFRGLVVDGMMGLPTSRTFIPYHLESAVAKA
jgi:hypothetical protein